MTAFYFNPNASSFTKELLTLVCLGEVKPMPKQKLAHRFNNGLEENIGHPQIFRSRFRRPVTTYAISNYI